MIATASLGVEVIFEHLPQGLPDCSCRLSLIGDLKLHEEAAPMMCKLGINPLLLLNKSDTEFISQPRLEGVGQMNMFALDQSHCRRRIARVCLPEKYGVLNILFRQSAISMLSLLGGFLELMHFGLIQFKNSDDSRPRMFICERDKCLVPININQMAPARSPRRFDRRLLVKSIRNFP